MATLAILSALAEEQQGLLACLSQPVCLRRAGREVWRGQWQGHEVNSLRKKLRNQSKVWAPPMWCSPGWLAASAQGFG